MKTMKIIIIIMKIMRSMRILSDNVLKKIQFLLYALVMLVVSFSCAHKKQSPDLAPTENSMAEEEVRCTNFFGILVRLNAPLLSSAPYTITIISSDKAKEWNFRIDADREKVYKELDGYF